MVSAVKRAAEMLTRREPACGRTRVVAVDGRSGAGKTEFAGELAQLLGAPVFSLEDIYPGWHGLEATTPILRDVLAAIAVDEVGRAHRWDWERQRPGPPLSVQPSPLLVVEGVGAGAAALRPFLSLLIWIEASDDVRRHRALSRDGDVFAPWWDIWSAQESLHFQRELTATAADLVVENN